jgi:ribosomal protein S18 acetylase RimI-like enzyme
LGGRLDSFEWIATLNEMQLGEVSFGSAAYDECVRLRNEILRAPLGLTFTTEDVEQDRKDFHLECRADGRLVGCLVLTPKTGGEIKMRQVAVASKLQGAGIGRRLVQFSEEFAIARGFTLMTMHARVTAVRFYEKLGYEVASEEFVEVTIPHRVMRKQLGQSRG